METIKGHRDKLRRQYYQDFAEWLPIEGVEEVWRASFDSPDFQRIFEFLARSASEVEQYILGLDELQREEFAFALSLIDYHVTVLVAMQGYIMDARDLLKALFIHSGGNGQAQYDAALVKLRMEVAPLFQLHPDSIAIAKETIDAARHAWPSLTEIRKCSDDTPTPRHV